MAKYFCFYRSNNFLQLLLLSFFRYAISFRDFELRILYNETIAWRLLALILSSFFLRSINTHYFLFYDQLKYKILLKYAIACTEYFKMILAICLEVVPSPETPFSLSLYYISIRRLIDTKIINNICGLHLVNNKRSQNQSITPIIS